MKTLVVYKSKTGFSKKYAEIIAEKLDADILNFSEASISKLNEYKIVIYGAGLYAESINGLSKMKNMFEKSKCEKLILFAVGASPNTRAEKINKMWQGNLSDKELNKYPHFYMQGGINYEKMDAFNRFNMKMFAKMMNAKAQKGNFDKEFASLISSSHDISSPKYADELINFVKSI